MKHSRRLRSWRGWAGVFFAAATLAVGGAGRAPIDRRAAAAGPKLPDMSTAEAKLKALDYFRRTGPWKTIKHNSTITPKDLDKQLERENKLSDDHYAPLADDASFMRRVSFDLTGQPPDPAALRKFLADKSVNKRAKLIDQLLDSEAFATRWAHFWRNVMFFNAPANANRVNYEAFEKWLAGQFRQHVSWDRIVAEILAADGKDKDKGPDNFVLACENQPTQLASETARVFMGVSIQCAECHDHPFDRWKREQFHELAAFFSPGKYYMPDLQHPENKTEMPARFLLGENPPPNLKADARRVAVAAFLVYNPNNYWFARAYINRIWSELVGDGFYAVDSLGPDEEAVHKLIINRMAYVFRNEQFDARWPFRLIMNSRVYQRQIRPLQSSEELFTAVRATRLRSDQVAQSLLRVTGNDKVAAEAERIFAVDPSIPLSDVEGAIQQSLFLMNNPGLQSAIKNGPLTARLAKISSPDQLADELYQNVLSRRPTWEERRRVADYLQSAGNRGEVVADLVWVLVNSAEFITKR